MVTFPYYVSLQYGIFRDGECQGFYELFVSTELPNNELTSIHTHDLPHLLL